jgi:polysaccharide export outer membrane protein
MKRCERVFLLAIAFLISISSFSSVSVAAAQSVEPSDVVKSTPDALQETQPASPEDAASSVSSPIGGGTLGPDYVLGPEDVVNIEVFNVPELRQTLRVENDGTIWVKLLGRVKAAGLTTSALRRELESEWGKTYLENPKVTIFVREFHGQPVSIIGAVERPGIYQLPGPRTLVEALSMAGGLVKRTNGSAGRTLYVTRKEGFKDLEMVPGIRQVAPNQVEISLKLLLYSRDVGLNIQVKPFDIISVSKAGIVYVAGEVKKPGGFLLDDRDTFTVLEALALAEGTTASAARRSARLIHRSDDGTLSETPVDVGKILNGKAEDVILTANDVLFIPNSRAKYAGKRTAETVIATLTGLIVFKGL